LDKFNACMSHRYAREVSREVLKSLACSVEVV
jgi:hypothetical protein